MQYTPRFTDRENAIIHELLSKWSPSHFERAVHFKNRTGRPISTNTLKKLANRWGLTGLTGTAAKAAQPTRVRPCDLCGDPGGRRYGGETRPARYSGHPWGLEGSVCAGCRDDLERERKDAEPEPEPVVVPLPPRMTEAQVVALYLHPPQRPRGPIYGRRRDEDDTETEKVKGASLAAKGSGKAPSRASVERMTPAQASRWIRKHLGPIVRRYEKAPASAVGERNCPEMVP